MYKRLISLPKTPTRSFFLWGPRQAGKSTLLKQCYPDALVIDLLKSDEFVRFQQSPDLLRTEVAAQSKGRLIIIDEVQKVPALLDEVHWLIENKRAVFGLCGSSARKLKRGKANLLGGRAIRFDLFGLSAREIGNAWSLHKLLNQGYLPSHHDTPASEWNQVIRSYVSDYLKEEIAAEATVRNLGAFTSFLQAAATSEAELVSFSTFGRDVGVSGHTVREYFEILVDTLQGHWVPAFLEKPKRRTREAPKFYFEDVGVANYLAKRGSLEPGTPVFGKAFENWVFHELNLFESYHQQDRSICYWHLASGGEVDFILPGRKLAIEAKATARVHSDHMKGLRALSNEYPSFTSRVIVSLEKRPRKTEDGILILSPEEFVQRLWAMQWK